MLSHRISIIEGTLHSSCSSGFYLRNWAPQKRLNANALLVFYCLITNYHKLSSLKYHAFIISQFLWVRHESRDNLAGSFAEGHKDAVKMLAGVAVLSEA